MIPTSTQTGYSSRITVIDALRGFALYGIILAHTGAIYLFELDITTKNLVDLDAFFKQLLELFVERKFYLIFSLLFGFSFSIQLRNAKGDKPFVPKYIWRLFILFIIGYAHNQLYPFDILQIYAVIGLMLIPMRKLSASTLLFFSISLFLFSCLFLHFSEDIKVSLTAWKIRDISLTKTITQQIASGHLTMILSLFVLGFWAGKKEIFQPNGINIVFFRRLVLISVVSICLLKATSYLFNFSSFTIPLMNISFSFLYMGIFCLLYTLLPTAKLLWYCLESVGKMGLTNYVIQSVFFFTLFQIRDISILRGEFVLLIALANLFFLIQILFSILWFKRFKFGPIEWLWRITTNLYKPIRHLKKGRLEVR